MLKKSNEYNPQDSRPSVKLQGTRSKLLFFAIIEYERFLQSKNAKCHNIHQGLHG